MRIVFPNRARIHVRDERNYLFPLDALPGNDALPLNVCTDNEQEGGYTDKEMGPRE